MTTLASTLVPLFVGACTLIASVGFFAVWAEFRSSSAQNSYTRYSHYAR
jgi:hypothetical protein